MLVQSLWTKGLQNSVNTFRVSSTFTVTVWLRAGTAQSNFSPVCWRHLVAKVGEVYAEVPDFTLDFSIQI